MPSAQLYRCHHVYAPQRDDELGMEPGDLIMIRSQPHLDWWIGDNLRTGQKEAWFPYNFVDPVEPPTLTPPPPPPHRRTPSQTPPQLTITATPQNETSAVPIVSAIPQPPSADQAGAAVSAVLNTVQKRHKHQQQHQQQQHQHQHQSRLPSPKVHSSSSDKRVITLRRSQNQLSFDGSDTGSPISSGIGSALHLTKTSDSSNSGGIGNSSMRFKRPPPPPPPPHPSYPQHHPHPHLPQLQMQGQTGRHGLSSNPCIGLSPPPPPPSLSPPPPMPTAIPSIASILDGGSSGGCGGSSSNDNKTPTRSANTFTSASTIADTSTKCDQHGIGKVNDQEADKSPVDSACHSTIISPQKNLSLSASVVSSLHHTVASKSSTSSLKVQPTASFFVNNIEPKSMSAASSPMVPVVTNKNDTAKLPNITSVNQLAASTTNRIAELQKRFATRRAAAVTTSPPSPTNISVITPISQKQTPVQTQAQTQIQSLMQTTPVAPALSDTVSTKAAASNAVSVDLDQLRELMRNEVTKVVGAAMKEAQEQITSNLASINQQIAASVEEHQRDAISVNERMAVLEKSMAEISANVNQVQSDIAQISQWFKLLLNIDE